MPPVPLHVPAFQVVGISVRTRNSDEMDPATARIGNLWDRFFSQSWERNLPGPGRDGRIYGVYSAYESNAQGAYDMTAGVAMPPPAGHRDDGGDGADRAVATASGTVCVVPVLAGNYLVFNGQGPMPQMVIDTWRQIWRYFADNPQVQRRFGTDFEAYSGPDQVAIHIGVVGG